jgi:hypothetical protein
MKIKPTLMEETKKLLLTRSITISTEMIAKEVGKTRQWVNKFAAGLILDPSVNAIEKMNIYLKSVRDNDR